MHWYRAFRVGAEDEGYFWWFCGIVSNVVTQGGVGQVGILGRTQGIGRKDIPMG